MDIPQASSLVQCFHVDLEFRMLVFCGGRKTGELKEKYIGARTRTNNKHNPHVTPGLGIELGLNSWEQALSPLYHPCSPVNEI